MSGRKVAGVVKMPGVKVVLILFLNRAQTYQAPTCDASGALLHGSCLPSGGEPCAGLQVFATCCGLGDPRSAGDMHAVVKLVFKQGLVCK